ncbi:unnamed protein product [Ectocarpus sp. 6 AP-2014]
MVRRGSCAGACVVACVLAVAPAPSAAFLSSPRLAKVGTSRANGARGATRTGAMHMSGLPADFDPLSPSMDHLSMIDQASKGRSQPSMIGGAGGVTEDRNTDLDGARVGPPPDLPSLLLHNRIVYLGMPLVPAVTELIIAELLYLNYESASKPVYMYINTPGTSTPDGRAIGFETEAFAISDCMNYIKPPVYTIGVGQAFGLGAMLLASGEKGHRSALPNASIMLHQPRSMARGQASDIAIKAKEVMANRKTATQMLSEACGKPYDEVLEDSSRTFYMSPDDAVEYGLIDKVLRSSKKDDVVAPAFLDALSMGSKTNRQSLYED